MSRKFSLTLSVEVTVIVPDDCDDEFELDDIGDDTLGCVSQAMENASRQGHAHDILPDKTDLIDVMVKVDSVVPVD